MLKRFGVSLDEELLEKYDYFLSKEGYSNRSEGIRDLIRDVLVRKMWRDSSSKIAGVTILVYNHHRHELAKKMMDLQHHHHDFIISSMHAHLDTSNCLEAILMQGRATDIKRFSDSLLSMRGVKHGQFVPTTNGSGL